MRQNTSISPKNSNSTNSKSFVNKTVNKSTPLDTLAQLSRYPKEKLKLETKKSGSIVKKQWAKYISTFVAVNLIESNRGGVLEKSYRNTVYCSYVQLRTDEDKIKSTYCKNRWCYTCNRIRTAQWINGYLPELEKLKDPYFVTLTLPTVDRNDLKAQIDRMQDTWRKIYRKAQRVSYNRLNGTFKGIRKAECTIRPNDKYHFHYHIILSGKGPAEWLINEWLQHFPEANQDAQDYRKADENSFKELFKYFTKLTSKTNKTVDYKRLNVIFEELRGRRVYQPFGGIKAIDEEDFEELAPDIEVKNRFDRIYRWVDDDWYGLATGEGLSGKRIPEKIEELKGKFEK